MRTCTLELESVRSSSVFSVPCRLQPKILCVFNQGNALFEDLIQRLKHNYVRRTGLARLNSMARVSILSL